MLADFRARWLVPVMMLLVALQLAACSDKDKEQQQAFTAFLQSLPQQGRQLPGLSEQQQQAFGRYAQDYAIVTNFNQQLDQAVAGSLTPLLQQVARIRVPQDYISQRDNLRQSVGALNLLGQQVQTAKTQADNARRALKQPEALQAVYDKLYQRTVAQPATAMVAIVPASVSFTQSLIQLGDFLQAQGSQVLFNGTGVQFRTQPLVDQYNGMVSDLANQQQSLFSALQAQGLISR